MTPHETTLLDLLRQKRLVSEEDLALAVRLREQRGDGASLADLLVGLGCLTPGQRTALLVDLRTPYPGLDTPTIDGLDTPTISDASPPLAAARPAPFPGYEVLEEIGRGGMGVVYKARQVALGRTVALKVLMPGEHASKDMLDRFQREARACAKLQHPNIVEVYDAGRYGEVHYFTMRYVEGLPLSALVRDKGLEPRRALELARKVALALEYAHRQGVIHRDVKPGNILIDAAGEPHVADFGLAKDVKAGGTTVSGTGLGTPSYASPEQLEGGGAKVDARTDVYGLGATLYEMLTGDPPFPGESLFAVVSDVLSREPVPVRARKMELHRDVETLCMKALEKDPARRYQTAEEMAEDIHRHLEGEPVRARAVGRIERLWRKASRNRRIVIPIACLALAAAAALSWVAVQASRRARDVTHLQEQADARAKAEREAMQLLEAGRPALDDASRYLYGKDATYEELCRRVALGKGRIEQAVAKAPWMPLAHHLLARAWKLLGQDESAEACWKEAIRLDAWFGPAHLHLGMLYLERAIGLESSSLMLSPNESAARATRALADARTQLEAAAGLSWAGEEDGARRLLAAAQAYVARDTDRVVELGREAAKHLGDHDGSERIVVLAALVQTGETRRALLDSILAAAPLDAFARSVRGCDREVARDADGALADLDQCVALRPRDALAFCNRGGAHLLKGDLDKSIADYTRAIDLAPEYAEAFCTRGLARQSKGDIAGALADYDHAITIEPDSARAHANRALARQANGDWAGAFADYDEAISLDGKDAAVLCNRGHARLDHQELEAALADFNRLIDMNPSYAEGWFNRGIVRFTKGDVSGALSDFSKSIDLQPGYYDAFLNRGLVRLQAGAIDEGIADLEHSLALAPGRWNRRAMAQQGIDAAKQAKAGVVAPSWQASLARGDQAVQAGDYVRAKDAYEEAVQQAGEGAEADPAARPTLLNARYNLACIYSLLSIGQSGPRSEAHAVAADDAARCRERAFRHLRKAIELGYTDRAHVESDGDLAPLHDDARWRDVLDTIQPR